MKYFFHKCFLWLTGRTFFWALAKQIGFFGAWIYVRTASRQEASSVSSYRLRTRELKSPLWCRPGSSDRAVFNQVFIEGQYARLPLRGDERLILDCGANVGYASAFFLSRCPHAHVVAVEPEPDNFRMLERNLQPYGDRVTVIQSAVWPRPTRLRMVSGLVGWAARVEETEETGADTFAALDLSTLLAPFPGQRVDILKVDIEGAEEHLFGGQTEEWIGRIDVCAAELHGPECEKAFHGLFVEKEFECYQRGELMIAVRRHGKGLPLESFGTVVAAVSAV